MITSHYADDSQTVAQLLAAVASGEIAVPFWQRSYAWTTRDVIMLFESLYRRLPIGTLALWEAPDCRSTPIGVKPKPVKPRLMVVDGQQRLTALHAVMSGASVLDRRGNELGCRLAFNPGEQHFTATSARIRKNPEYLPDIRVLWSGDKSLHQITEAFLQRLRAHRDLSAEEEDGIAARLRHLQSIPEYRVYLSELDSSITQRQAMELYRSRNWWNTRQ